MKKWIFTIKKIIYSLVCLLSLFGVSFVQANPAPFGFELSRTKLSDIESKHSVIKKEKNAYLGHNYYVDQKDLPLEGLIEACFILDEEKTLQGVVLTMDKKRFDDMFQSLSKKYDIISQNIPFVGNKKVIYKDDDSLVILDAPHMNFNMSINYVTRKLHNTFIDISNKETEEKKTQEESVL